MRSIFVAATGQHVGKTTIALGLLAAFKAKGLRCQFFKPVGQHFAEHGGHRADEDAWLCRQILQTEVEAELMSPIIVPSGYVAQYLEHPEPDRLRLRILEAEASLRANADLLVVEGTGHAGVGSCLDLSNAVVAKMLNALALIVVPGGIGRSLDDLALSLTLFRAHGVPIVGVVANKIYKDKFGKVAQSLRIGLDRLGTRLLGAIPYEPELSYPTVQQLCDELGARVLCGDDALGRVVAHTLIAAMTPQNVLGYVQRDSLVITPGDRVDNILMAISADLMAKDSSGNIAGIVLTGGFMPPMAMMPLLKRSGLPVLLCNEDTYTISSAISQRVFKIDPGDTGKIEAAQRFVRDYVDVDLILSKAQSDT